MPYLVRFYDRSDRRSVRDKFMAAHMAWLESMPEKILVAGALRETPESFPVGGLWLVEAGSRGEVEALLASDPFWTNGLRERYEIFFFAPAVGSVSGGTGASGNRGAPPES
jgi:uncharacterized protein